MPSIDAPADSASEATPPSGTLLEFLGSRVGSATGAGVALSWDVRRRSVTVPHGEVGRRMSYTDFTLDAAESRLGLVTGLGDLFPDLRPVPVPAWLSDQLARGRAVAALVSEKARSEFLVAPVLLACRELVSGDLAIYSGQRLDIDAARGLVGECDYILALTAPVPRLRAPLVMVLEAKRGDIELGLGQCVAQMVAARLFNERAGSAPGPVYGAVTTGEAWQFLRLDGAAVTLHPERLFIDNVGGILAALRSALLAASATAA